MESEPDYGKYSLIELYQVYHNINRKKFGDRFDAVVKEIEKREQIATKNPELKHYSFHIGKIRSFWSILGLTFITMGIYLLYWTYKNIDEINKYFHFYKSKNDSSVAKKLFGYYISSAIASVLIMIVLLIVFGKDIILKNIIVFGFSCCMLIFNIIVHYYFVASVNLAHKEVKIDSFKVFDILIFYILSCLLVIFYRLFPILSIGSYFFDLIFIYLIQEEINKIWIKVNEKIA